jgi:hypothetical protein
MKADASNATSLRNALDMYCASSGQLVSVAKSSIFFSPNTSAETREEVCEILDILVEALNDKYLGLPSLVGADRSDSCNYLIDRVWDLINGWNEKTLSTGAKEVLLKAVAQAIPAYAMSVFNIPKQVCKSICDAIARYWWGVLRRRKECIGGHGGKCVFQKKKGEWDSGTYIVLIKQCWQNNVGDCLVTRIHCVHRYYGRSIIWMVIC